MKTVFSFFCAILPFFLSLPTEATTWVTGEKISISEDQVVITGAVQRKAVLSVLKKGPMQFKQFG